MLKHVEPANCVGFYKFAALYRLDKLQRKANRAINSEFKTVAFIDEFKNLSRIKLIELIKDDDVNVEYEDVVFESVQDWVRYDIDNRKSSFETIVELVRLPYCTSSYLRHTKDTCDLLTPKCFEYVHEALSFQADTAHQHEISSGRTVPRTNTRSAVAARYHAPTRDQQWPHGTTHQHEISSGRTVPRTNTRSAVAARYHAPTRDQQWPNEVLSPGTWRNDSFDGRRQ